VFEKDENGTISLYKRIKLDVPVNQSDPLIKRLFYSRNKSASNDVTLLNIIFKGKNGRQVLTDSEGRSCVLKGKLCYMNTLKRSRRQVYLIKRIRFQF